MQVATRDLQRLHSVIEALKAKLGEDLVALVLFGSRARAERASLSDWDLFLVAERLPEHPFDRQVELRSLLPTVAEGVSMVAKTREEFQAGFPPLYLDLAVDGVVLYDPENYMTAKLEEIRGIIRHAGLWRSRRKDGFIWKWRRRPQGGWRIDWSGLHGFEGGGAL
jgi:predicted nucleotidyltransferase